MATGQFAGWSDEKLSDYIASKPLDNRGYGEGRNYMADSRYYNAQLEARQRESARRKNSNTANLAEIRAKEQQQRYPSAENDRKSNAAIRQQETASRLARERDERLNKYETEARQREEDSIAEREAKWERQQEVYKAQQAESDRRAEIRSAKQAEEFRLAAAAREKSANEMMNTYNKGMDSSIRSIQSSQEGATKLLEPWRKFGVDALGKLSRKVSSGPGDYKQAPGYQARLAEGTRAVESSAAARGGALSGRAMKEAARFNQEFATNDYDNFLRRYYDSLQPLQSVAAMGQSAAGAQGGYLQRAGSEKANIYQTGAGNIAKAQMYGGESKAEGIEAGSNIMAAQGQAREDRDYAYNTFQMGNRG